MIAWQTAASVCETRPAEAGAVMVGPHPDKTGWSKPYAMTSGGAWLAAKDFSAMRAAFQVMMDFNTLVVRDGMDPRKVHEAFLAIDEYRFHVSPEIGADWPEWYEELVRKERAWRREADSRGSSF